MSAKKEKNQPAGEAVEPVQETPAEAVQEANTLDELSQELEAMKDKHLRVCAEYDNFRKRSIKEREGLYTHAAADVIAAFLPVIDNMERACAAVEADAGVRMILKQMTGVLEKYSVSSVGAVGEAFDPMLHESVAHEESESGGGSCVTEVLQKGYIMGDRLIRPAMVKTAG